MPFAALPNRLIHSIVHHGSTHQGFIDHKHKVWLYHPSPSKDTPSSTARYLRFSKYLFHLIAYCIFFISLMT